MALSLLVAVETVVRKLFNFSLQGADELGGYALAVCATIAFSLALLGRTHIRVDVFPRAPAGAGCRQALNWLSVVLHRGLLALLLAWPVLVRAAGIRRGYQSVSQTPWATPLAMAADGLGHRPGLVVFAAVVVGHGRRARHPGCW